MICTRSDLIELHNITELYPILIEIKRLILIHIGSTYPFKSLGKISFVRFV